MNRSVRHPAPGSPEDWDAREQIFIYMTVSARIKKERAIPVKFVNDYLLIGRLFGNRGTSARRREKLALQDSIRQSGQGTCNTSKSAVHYYLLRRSLVLCLSVGDLMSYFF